MSFVEIQWQSDLYLQEIELRDAILRKPLGLAFTEEDLSAEASHGHYGIVIDERLIACVVAVPMSPTHMKLRQMAVVEDRQQQGFGTILIRGIEADLCQKGIRSLELNARDFAVGFYQRLGYRTASDAFIEVGITHYKMVKDL